MTIDLFKHHLPPKIFKKIDLKSLQLTNKSFVSEEYSDKHSDLIFKAKIDNNDGYVYQILEHQSTNDDYMGIRLLEYNTSLIRQHMKEFKTNKAPIILNILVYAGKEKYKGPKSMLEMFENPDLAKEIMFKDFHIVDLQSTDINKLSKDKKAALAEIFLKQGIMRDFCNLLENNVGILRKLMSETLYLERAISYIFYIEGHNKTKIVDLLNNITKNKEVIMTVAQQFENEGRKKGVLDTARNLLKMNLDKSMIQKATGLSKKQIEDLNKKK